MNVPQKMPLRVLLLQDVLLPQHECCRWKMLLLLLPFHQ
jgi:hypothetical protein